MVLTTDTSVGQGTLVRRQPVRAERGLVASSHPAISFAGARVLDDGGNAVDAALAMAATSWLALPGQCGVGGDAFVLVREPDGRVWSVNGSGFGPDGADPAFFADAGLDAIPEEGPLSVAVPGAPAALGQLHAHGAGRELGALWAPAAERAERGLSCTAKTVEDLGAHRAALERDPGARQRLLPEHRLPRPGERLPQPELAATIRGLAADPGSFYTGELAERALTALCEAGAPFSGEEWELTGEITPELPLSGRYRQHTVYQTPLPTPGWMVLQQAAVNDGILEGYPLLCAEAVHLMACAARLAFDDRLARCGSQDEAWRETLTKEAITRARRRIAEGAVPRGGAGAPDGDTTSMVTVDGEGRSVSLIQSLAFTFGARCAIPGTGVILNNRLGRGAYLDLGNTAHPNQVRPRRKPLHTLNAWIATDSQGRLAHVGNTPGGDGQVQWNAQLLSHLLDHGLDPQEAVDAPRFTVHPGSDAGALGDVEELRCETRLGVETLNGLHARGHQVRSTGPWQGGGSAIVISVDPAHGCLSGGADSRQDGVALGV